MKLSEIYAVVDGYYQFRGLTYPNLFDAAYWLATEVGELQNALTRLESGWVRNNSEDEPLEWVSDELGDVLMMFCVTAHLAGVDDGFNYQPLLVDYASYKYLTACIGVSANGLVVNAKPPASLNLIKAHIHRLCEFLQQLSSYLQINPYQAMLKKFHKKVMVEHSKIADDFANWDAYRLYLETLIEAV